MGDRLHKSTYTVPTRLILLCVLAASLLVGCGKAPEADPTPTPLPLQTADPRLTGDARTLQEKLIEGARYALQLEERVFVEDPGIVSARVPDQLLNQFLDALADGKPWTHSGGTYTKTASSSGDYTYEKPYSELITGSSTDVFTIEDDTGFVEEIVDNTRFDPFTWVMSGEGGGTFAYMTVYELAEDAAAGSIETVSRLNGDISGWSRDMFRTEAGRYRFADLQLSPDEEGQIKAPYQWILCVGDIGEKDARIMEIGIETAELALPADLILDGTLLDQAERRGVKRSQLILDSGNINYTDYSLGK